MLLLVRVIRHTGHGAGGAAATSLPTPPGCAAGEATLARKGAAWRLDGPQRIARSFAYTRDVYFPSAFSAICVLFQFLPPPPRGAPAPRHAILFTQSTNSLFVLGDLRLYAPQMWSGATQNYHPKCKISTKSFPREKGGKDLWLLNFGSAWKVRVAVSTNVTIEVRAAPFAPGNAAGLTRRALHAEPDRKRSRTRWHRDTH